MVFGKDQNTVAVLNKEIYINQTGYDEQQSVIDGGKINNNNNIYTVVDVTYLQFLGQSNPFLTAE